MSGLISESYQKLNRDLHEDPKFGTSAGTPHATSISDIVNRAGCRTLLDYGCGKGTLKLALQPLCPNLDIREYDPARPGKTQLPEPADIVACFDVMEHVEPDFLDGVLDHIKTLTKRFAFFIIALVEADKILPDGRNAHLIIQPTEWWLDQIARRFDVLDARPIRGDYELMVFVKAK